MEFILLLGKLEKEILDLIKKAEYTIVENSPICEIGTNFVGFHNGNEKLIVICTENAKRLGNYKENQVMNDNDNHKTKLYIRRALRHEATHVAQWCNENKITGIIQNLEDKIHENKLRALESSIGFSGNLMMEIEAYVMEDKPRSVIKALEKYCF